jgi:hypothetical protein
LRRRPGQPTPAHQVTPFSGTRSSLLVRCLMRRSSSV